jgi:hypothetical protein
MELGRPCRMSETCTGHRVHRLTDADLITVTA